MLVLLSAILVPVGVALGAVALQLKKRAERLRSELAEAHPPISRAQKLDSEGGMAANVAHSFKDVPTPIIGRSQLLSQRTTDPRRREWARWAVGGASLPEREGMATERLTTRHLREILRQNWLLGRSHRDVALSLGLSSGAVGTTVLRARAAGLDWPQVQALADAALEMRLYGRPEAAGQRQRPQPDCAYLHAARRKPGVTLKLLHLEYLEQHPDGYRYTRFCELYRHWLQRRGPSMRRVHRAGDKCFVDYAGQKPTLIDPATGEVSEVELFVAVLGASNFTYVEATRTQVPDWMASHHRAFAFFGGVTSAIVCDQLENGVVTPCRDEPGLQRTYEQFARHYGTAIVPARQGKARDKAKIEVGVQVAERWILARLRHEQFFSLETLNARIAELREDLNGRRMRLYEASRRELFERLDRPALRPLPPQPFVYGEWKTTRVNIDYHVKLHRHYYSVPYSLARKVVEARLTATTVECFHRGQRVAAHVRDDTPGRRTTDPAHMPKAHQRHLEWTPSRLTDWAERIGPQTRALVAAILADRPHPEQGYRSCLGLLRLGGRYGEPQLEAACGRALAIGARSYRHVDSILKRGLEQLPLPTTAPPGARIRSTSTCAAARTTKTLPPTMTPSSLRAGFPLGRETGISRPSRNALLKATRPSPAPPAKSGVRAPRPLRHRTRATRRRPRAPPWRSPARDPRS